MLNISITLLSLLFVFSIFKMGFFLKELYDNRKMSTELAEDVVTIEKAVVNGIEVDKLTIDFEFLKKSNKDIKGWIRYNGGKVDYPVLQTDNNNYYLNHSFNKKKNSLGSIFMDYRNSSFEDKNTVLFGHNSSNGDMFGSLKDALDEGFFDDEKNRVIQIVDLDNNNNYYEIFSVYTITKEEYYITTDFNTDEEYTKFLETISKRSVKKFDVDLSTIQNVLTLSTCKGVAGTDKRFVIHARLMED